MKLALTVQGVEADAALDERFGRAPFFRLVDIDTGATTTIENAGGVNASHGAGTQAAQILARHGVQGLITGQVGPKAWSALQASGVRVYSASGVRVAQAVEAFRAGQLRELSQADGLSHR